MTVNPYLNFPGTAEAAFNFYKSVFGGEFTRVERFKGMPGSEKLPAGILEQVLHISLPIAPGCILMGSNAPAEMGFKLVLGNNAYISLSPDSREETKRLFDGLSAGGNVEMELADAFWGAYFGSFEDKFGIHWMVNCEKKA